MIGNIKNEIWLFQTQIHTSGQAYGPGNYFSEFPDISIPYGQRGPGGIGLMLFRVLPGKEYEKSNSGDIPAGFNTKKVRGDPKGLGEMLVIKDPKQFLPYIVYNLS